MKRILLIAVFVALVCGVIVLGGARYETVRAASTQQWEYKLEYKMNEKKANALGAEGWELATVSSIGSGPASNVSEYVFKRPKN